MCFFFFSSRRRHTRSDRDWSSDVCSSDLAWITSNPARALGLSDRVGTLAPGMDADAVLWSGDPFSVYSHPDLVFIDGALAFDRSGRARAGVPDFQLGREPIP